jgi:hypothetical protein
VRIEFPWELNGRIFSILPPTGCLLKSDDKEVLGIKCSYMLNIASIEFSSGKYLFQD